MRASKLHYAEAFCLTFLILAGHFFPLLPGVPASGIGITSSHTDELIAFTGMPSQAARGDYYSIMATPSKRWCFFWCIKLWGKLGWSSLHHVQVVAVLWKMDSGFESELWTRSWTFCRTKRKDVLPKRSKNRGSGRATCLTMGLRLLLRYRLDLDMICFFEVRLRKSKCLPVFCLCWGQCF